MYIFSCCCYGLSGVNNCCLQTLENDRGQPWNGVGIERMQLGAVRWLYDRYHGYGVSVRRALVVIQNASDRLTVSSRRRRRCCCCCCRVTADEPRGAQLANVGDRIGENPSPRLPGCNSVIWATGRFAWKDQQLENGGSTVNTQPIVSAIMPLWFACDTRRISWISVFWLIDWLIDLIATWWKTLKWPWKVQNHHGTMDFSFHVNLELHILHCTAAAQALRKKRWWVVGQQTPTDPLLLTVYLSSREAKLAERRGNYKSTDTANEVRETTVAVKTSRSHAADLNWNGRTTKRD